MSNEWQVRTDGAARGNPGPAGVGVVLVDPEGNVVEKLARGIGWATNNVAEYRALIEGLKLARSHGADRLRVFSDSALMVQQMRGAYKVRHEALRPLHRAALQALADFERWSIRTVPRARNAHADALVNAALDRAPPAPA